MKKVFFTTQGETPGYSPEFLGRNGGGKMIGILISHAIGNIAQLWPIRKNGIEGRAMLSIPMQDISSLIEALQAFRDQHAPASTHTPQGEQPKIDGPKPLSIKIGKNYRLKNGYIAHIDGRDLVCNPAYPFFSKLTVDSNLWFAKDGSSRQYEGKIDVVEEVPTPKFEIGKKYVNRNLDVTIIAHITTANNGKPLLLHGFDKNNVCQTFQPNGQFADWQTSVLDLVDEYREQ